MSSASVTRSHCRQPAERCGWMASCIASGSHWAGGPDICGHNLASRPAIPVSKDTLLRAVRRRAARPRDSLRAVGIDDWAWRKGCRYGTVICDLERRRIFEGKITCAWDTAKRFLNYLLASLGYELAKANSHLFLAIHRERHYWRSLFALPHAQCVQLYLFMRGNVNRRHGHGCFLHFCRAAAVAARHHAAIACNTLPANA